MLSLKSPNQFVIHPSETARLCTLRLCGESLSDDCHRPELNHRDTEDTEDSASKEPQMKFCGLRSSPCTLRLCGESRR